MEALNTSQVADNAVPHPVFLVTIAGRNVTADLTPFVLSVSYTDFEEGQADTIDIRLEDVDGRFRGSWYPTKGDAVMLRLGFQGQPLLDAGRFEIDQIGLGGPPDIVTLSAIAAGVTTPYRTHQGRAYENTTLDAIARRVAQRLKLQLVGTIEPIQIRRATQIHENDLTFLRRLAGEYGYAFSVKGARMVFFKHAELWLQETILTLDRTELTRYHLKDKIMGVVGEAKVAYHDPKTKRTKHYTVRDTSRATSSDSLKLNSRAESAAQAQAKARAALDKANGEGTVLEGTVYGNPKLVAGINFGLSGMGVLGGGYHVVRSRHDIDRDGGYRTEFEAKRVKAPVQKTANKTTKKGQN